MSGWLEGGVVVPGVVGRSEWEQREAERDVEVLGWVARFRFVTGELVAVRFGVSVQRANARLRRLERVGLVERQAGPVGCALAVWVSRTGFEVLGQPGRGRPRSDVQRHHELAVVWTATRFEQGWPDARVLTERDCRIAEADGRRYSVQVDGAGRGERRRWPDLVVERLPAVWPSSWSSRPRRRSGRRASCAATRSATFVEVRWIVTLPTLAARLTELARLEGSRAGGTGPTVRVSAWPHLPADARGRIDAAVRSA